MRRILLTLVLLVLVVALIVPAQAQSASIHLALGNPTAATSDTTHPNNFLIVRPQYALAYHNDDGIPRWVSWHLELADLGPAPRCDCFKIDTLLPANWNRVSQSDYTGSGFDRGHMTPSEDRTATDADNEATFLMTNIIPQQPAANRGPWARLEDSSRTLTPDSSTPALALNELYIVSGPVGNLGRLASGNVRIPAASWKAELVLPVGENDLERITTATRLIAIRIPNNSVVLQSDAWEQYRTSVDAIEAELSLDGSNIDLFNALSPKIQRVLEARIDSGPLPYTLTLLAGDQQQAAVNSPFGTPLSVEVRDANHQPLSAVTVVFAALGSSADAWLTGNDTQLSVTTDANGRASVMATAIGAPGSYRVEASIDGVYTPVVFTLTNTSPQIQVYLPLVIRP